MVGDVVVTVGETPIIGVLVVVVGVTSVVVASWCGSSPLTTSSGDPKTMSYLLWGSPFPFSSRYSKDPRVFCSRSWSPGTSSGPERFEVGTTSVTEGSDTDSEERAGREGGRVWVSFDQRSSTIAASTSADVSLSSGPPSPCRDRLGCPNQLDVGESVVD